MATSIDNLGVQFRAIAKSSWDASKAQDNVFYSVQNSDNSYDLYLGKQLLSNQDEVNAAVGRIATSEQNIQALQAIVAGLEGTTVVSKSSISPSASVTLAARGSTVEVLKALILLSAFVPAVVIALGIVVLLITPIAVLLASTC